MPGHRRQPLRRPARQGPHAGPGQDARLRHAPPGPRHDDEFVGTQESVPGTRMPTLDEVFNLAERYGARNVQFNIETKIDPTAPTTRSTRSRSPRRSSTSSARTTRSAAACCSPSTGARSSIARHLEPRLRRVALGDATTIFPGSPWTAGIRDPADALQGSLARIVADQLHAQVVSLDFPILTDRLIRTSHRRGLSVIPWTVNMPADMASLIDRGVDGLITDYPDRLRDVVMAAKHLRLPRPSPRRSTSRAIAAGAATGREHARVVPVRPLAAGRHARARHRRDQGRRARRRARPQDQPGPLLRRDARRSPATLIHDLTLAQIKTLDCGSQGEFQGQPGWVASPGREDADAAGGLRPRQGQRRHRTVRMNIETKICPPAGDTAPYDVSRASSSGDRAQPHGAPRDDPVLRLAHDHPRQAARPADRDRRARVAVRRRRLRRPQRRVLAGGRGRRPDRKSPWTGGLDWWQFRDLGRRCAPPTRTSCRATGRSTTHTRARVSTDDYLKEDPAIFHGPPVAGLNRRACASCPTRSTTSRTCSA